MTLADITEWILGALIGIVMLLLGSLMKRTNEAQKNLQDADSTIHERISNEQKRTNLHAERLAALEADRASMREHLNRMEKKIETSVMRLEKKLDSLIQRRLEQ